MDSFWIYLIIGGIILLAPKGKNRNKKSDSKLPNGENQEPQNDLEQQLRELFGEKETEHQAPSNSTITRPVQHGTTIATPFSAKPAKSSNTAKKHSAIQPATKEPTPNPRPEVSQAGPNSQIEGIIEDFSMEKAVIYSEILKPKWEEL